MLNNPERIKKEYQNKISGNKNDESLNKELARREDQRKKGIDKLIDDNYEQENAARKNI